MSNNDIRAGRAFIEIALRDNLSKPIDKIGRKFESIGKGIVKVGAGISAAGAGILGFLAAGTAQFAEYGSQLNDMSTRTGIAASSLAELGYAAKLSGASLEDVESGVRKAQKFIGTLAEGNEEARLTLAKLGVSYDQLRGQSPEEQFNSLARAIDKVHDPSEKAAAAMKVLGKGGTALLPMIAEMDKLRAEARELGLAPSQEAVEAADKVGDSMDRVKSQVGATFFEIGHAISGPVLSKLSIFSTLLSGTIKWVRANHEVVTSVLAVGGALTVAGAVVTGVGIAIAGVGTALGGIATGIGVLGSGLALLLSPLGLIGAALVTGAVVWARYTESGQQTMAILGKGFGDLFKTFKTTLGGISDALQAGDLALAGKIAITGLKLVFLQGMSAISKAVGGVWGGTIASIAGSLVNGDLQGAWKTLVTNLAQLWDALCNGLVDSMSRAMKAVEDKFQPLQKDIAAKLAADETESKQVGPDHTGSGVSSREEAIRERRLNAEMIAQWRKELAEAKEALQQEEAMIADHVGAASPDRAQSIRDRIKDIEGSLSRTKVPTAAEQTAAAAKSAAAGVGAASAKFQSGAMSAVLGAFGAMGAFQPRGAAAAANAPGGDGLEDEIAALQKQLDGMNKHAHAEMLAKAAEQDGNAKKQGEAAGEVTAHVAGTFSASALQAMGGPQSVQQRQLTEMQQTKRAIITVAHKLDKIKDKLANINKAN